MVDDTKAAPATCANCGNSLAQRYCAQCGQDSHVTMTIRHFVDEFVEGMFHFDSTFWRTFLPLLFKPGFLTEQYLSGKRKSYAPPFRSYLVLSLIYFAVGSLVATPETRVVNLEGRQMTTQDCPLVAESWLRYLVPNVEESCRRALTDEGHAFSKALNGLLPKVMFVVLPLVALVQYLLNRRKRPLYVENLIFVLHFQSFYFLIGTLGLLLGAGIAAILGSPNQSVSEGFDFLLYAWSAYFLFVANRRVYRASVLKAGFNVLMLAAAYGVFWAVGVAVASLYEFARV